MKIWKYSLWLSVFSCCLLCVVFLLPKTYTVFIWNKFGVDAGILFPVLLISWTTALFGFALNNIFIDRAITDKKLQMSSFMKTLPSLLGLPSFGSFVWFIFRWYKGDPHR
jgi:hypothetical protein